MSVGRYWLRPLQPTQTAWQVSVQRRTGGLTATLAAALAALQAGGALLAGLAGLFADRRAALAMGRAGDLAANLAHGLAAGSLSGGLADELACACAVLFILRQGDGQVGEKLFDVIAFPAFVGRGALAHRLAPF